MYYKHLMHPLPTHLPRNKIGYDVARLTMVQDAGSWADECGSYILEMGGGAGGRVWVVLGDPRVGKHVA